MIIQEFHSYDLCHSMSKLKKPLELRIHGIHPFPVKSLKPHNSPENHGRNADGFLLTSHPERSFETLSGTAPFTL